MWNAPDEDKTFEEYYRRYEDIYITDCADWTDAKKSPATSTKARNSGTQVRRLYLTKKKKKICELGFLETVKLLSELFSTKTSLFYKRWKCLNLTKRDSDNYLRFASVVNKNYDDFKLGLYKFDRLVFGIKVAPAIFQQVMDTMLGGFDFTFAYLDDIVIWSKT